MSLDASYTQYAPGTEPSLYNQSTGLPLSTSTAAAPAPAANTSAATNGYDSQLTQYMQDQAQNPGLPPGTEFTYSPIQENQNEIIQPGTGQLGADKTGTTQPVTTAQAADPNQVAAGNYGATQIDPAQGEVTPEMTMKGQLASLYSDFADGKVPAWASGAMRKADEAMAARGLAASSIAGMSIAQAIQESAFPIAQFDANIFSQQAFLNQRNKQEALLSNQAADNAAKQFNAKSQQDTDMFMSQLASQVEQFNATQKNAMEQFSAKESNAMKEFYDTMNDKREQFNSLMDMEIAKSNVEWRRRINLANTAGENAETMINTQNRFNMSQQAMANLWQEARDVFQWANASAENDKDRAFRLTQYALSRNDLLNDRSYVEGRQLINGLGNLATNVVFGQTYNGTSLAQKGFDFLSNAFSSGGAVTSTSDSFNLGSAPPT